MPGATGVEVGKKLYAAIEASGTRQSKLRMSSSNATLAGLTLTLFEGFALGRFSLGLEPLQGQSNGIPTCFQFGETSAEIARDIIGIELCLDHAAEAVIVNAGPGC
jgi:hypothetical protein